MRVADLRGDRAVVRNDRAEQEGAEDGVDADELGGDRREQHGDQHQREALLADAASTASSRATTRTMIARPSGEHQRDVQRREHDRE